MFLFLFRSKQNLKMWDSELKLEEGKVKFVWFVQPNCQYFSQKCRVKQRNSDLSPLADKAACLSRNNSHSRRRFCRFSYNLLQFATQFQLPTILCLYSISQLLLLILTFILSFAPFHHSPELQGKRRKKEQKIEKARIIVKSKVKIDGCGGEEEKGSRKRTRKFEWKNRKFGNFITTTDISSLIPRICA